MWVSVCKSVCVCTTCQMILISYRLKQQVCDVCVKLNLSVGILMCMWVRYAPVIGCIDQALCKFRFV